MGQAVRRCAGGAAAAHQRRHRRRAAALRELPAVRLVVAADRRVRAAGLGADPGQHQAGRRFGYGFLFGAAFYIPLLPWISDWSG